MLLNKREFTEVQDQKVLRKIRSHWTVVSLALISAIGAGAFSIEIAHAQTNQSNNNNVKTQINTKLGQAYQKSETANTQPSSSTTLNQFANQHRVDSTSSANSIASHAKSIANQYRPSSTQVISDNAKRLTSGLMSNYIARHNERTNNNTSDKYNNTLDNDMVKYDVQKSHYDNLMAKLAGTINSVAFKKQQLQDQQTLARDKRDLATVSKSQLPANDIKNNSSTKEINNISKRVANTQLSRTAPSNSNNSNSNAPSDISNLAKQLEDAVDNKQISESSYQKAIRELKYAQNINSENNIDKFKHALINDVDVGNVAYPVTYLHPLEGSDDEISTIGHLGKNDASDPNYQGVFTGEQFFEKLDNLPVQAALNFGQIGKPASIANPFVDPNTDEGIAPPSNTYSDMSSDKIAISDNGREYLALDASQMTTTLPWEPSYETPDTSVHIDARTVGANGYTYYHVSKDGNPLGWVVLGPIPSDVEGNTDPNSPQQISVNMNINYVYNGQNEGSETMSGENGDSGTADGNGISQGYQLAGDGSSDFTFTNGSDNVNVVPAQETDNYTYTYNGNTIGSGSITQLFNTQINHYNSGLNSNYTLANDGSSDFQITGGQDHQINVNPKQYENYVDYDYNGQDVGSTTVTNGYNNSVTVDGTGLDKGYVLVNDGTQNITIGAPDSVHVVDVTLSPETDTINYVCNGAIEGSEQLSSLYSYHGTADGSGLNSDFELANDGTQNFTYTGTTHNVDVKHIPETDDVEYVYNGLEDEGSDTIHGVKGQEITINGNGLKQNLGDGFKLADDGTQNFAMEGVLHEVDVVPAQGETKIVATGFWTPDDKNDDGKASKWTLDNYGNLVINGGQMERTADSTKSDYPAGLKTSDVRSISFINRPKAPQWMPYLFENLPHLIKVNFRDLKIDGSRDTAFLLANDPHLIEVKMPRVTYDDDSADSMFSGDRNLKYIDLSGLNTDNVKTLANAIGGDHDLVYLKLGPDTTNLDRIDHKEANQTLFSTVAKEIAPQGWQSIAGNNKGSVVTDGHLLAGNTYLNKANSIQASPLYFTWHDVSSNESVNASDSTVNGSLYMPVDANDYLPIGYKLDPKSHYAPNQVNYLLTNHPQYANLNIIPDSMVDYGYWSYDDKNDNNNTAHWSIDDQGNLNIYKGIMEPLTTRRVLGQYADDIRAVNIFGLYGKVIAPTNMNSMFANLPNLQTVNTDINGFTTNQAKQWSHTFYNDPKLELANLSSWNIKPGPTGTLDNMFSNDSDLKYVDLSSLNTSDTNMDNFFGGKNLRNETDHADTKLAYIKLGNRALFDNAIDDDNALGEDPIDVMNSDAPQGWESLTGKDKGLVVENGLLKPDNAWYNIAHAIPGAPIIFRWYDAVNHKRVSGPDDMVKGVVGMSITASDYLPNGYILDPDKMYTPDQTTFTVSEKMQSPMLDVVPDKDTDHGLTSAYVTYMFGKKTLGKTQIMFNHGYNVSDITDSDLVYSDNGVNYALDPRTSAYKHGIEMITGRHYDVQLDRTGGWNDASYYLTPSDADTSITKAYGKGNLLLDDGTLGENSDTSDSDSAIAQATDLSDTKPIQSITFGAGLYAPSDAKQLFTKLPNLRSVNEAPHGIHQSTGLQLTHTHNISGIFEKDPKLTDINMSSWNTKKLSAKAMQDMVASDPALTNVELGHMTAMKSSGKITPGYTGTWMTNGGSIVDMNNNRHPKHEWYSKALPVKVTFSFGNYPEGSGIIMYNPNWGDRHNIASALMPKLPKNTTLYHSKEQPSYSIARNGSSVIQVLPRGIKDRGTWGQAYWKLTSDGTMHVISSPKGNDLDTNKWPAVKKSDVNKIVFSDKIKLPSDSSGIFSGLKNLSDFNSKNLDDSDTKTLSNAFASDGKLNDLNLSDMNGKKVSDASGMFRNDNLKHLDISKMRSHLKHDSDMFKGDFKNKGDTLKFNPGAMRFDPKNGSSDYFMPTGADKNSVREFAPHQIGSIDGEQSDTWMRVDPSDYAVKLNIVNQSDKPVEGLTSWTIYRPLKGSTVTPVQQLDYYFNPKLSPRRYTTDNARDKGLTYQTKPEQTAYIIGSVISDTFSLPARIITGANPIRTKDTTVKAHVRGRAGSRIKLENSDLPVIHNITDKGDDNAGTDYSVAIAYDNGKGISEQTPVYVRLDPYDFGKDIRVDYPRATFNKDHALTSGVEIIYHPYHGEASVIASQADSMNTSAEQSIGSIAQSSNGVSTVANGINASNASVSTEYQYLSSVASNSVNASDAMLKADAGSLGSDWSSLESLSTVASDASNDANALTEQADDKETAIKKLINRDLADDYQQIAKYETDSTANQYSDDLKASNTVDNASGKRNLVTNDSNAINTLQRQLKADVSKANADRVEWETARDDLNIARFSINSQVNADDTNRRDAVASMSNNVIAPVMASADNVNTMGTNDSRSNTEFSKAINSMSNHSSKLANGMKGWITDIGKIAPSEDRETDTELVSSGASVAGSVSNAFSEHYSSYRADYASLSNDINSLDDASGAISLLDANVSKAYVSASSASVVASESAVLMQSSGVISGEQTAESAMNIAKSSLGSLDNDKAQLNAKLATVKASFSAIESDSNEISEINYYLNSLSNETLDDEAQSCTENVGIDMSNATDNSSEASEIDSEIKQASASGASIYSTVKTDVGYGNQILSILGEPNTGLKQMFDNVKGIMNEITSERKQGNDAKRSLKATRLDIQNIYQRDSRASVNSIKDVLAIFRDSLKAERDQMLSESYEAKMIDVDRNMHNDIKTINKISSMVSSYLDNF